MGGLLLNLLANLLWFLFGVIAAWIYRLIFKIVPTKLLWRIKNPEKLMLCVATSSRDYTGEYHRAATGIGQVRGLAIINSSLTKAYRKVRIQNIILSDEELKTRLENDLILLGGPKNNEITRMFLEKIQSMCVVEQDERGICWILDQLNHELFSPITQDKKVQRDYGLIIRTRNPFTTRKTSICLFSGGHTYGVIAAAIYFTKEYRGILNLRKLFAKTLIAVVSCEIMDECPINIRLVKEHIL